jgi:hypothetical protein
MTQWQYSVEKFRPGDTVNASGGKAAIEAMLNGKAVEGWQFMESHVAPDGDGRYYVFKRELPTIPGTVPG